ncbi:MAG TPA: medium chain dehydrogenase/reductase family protein [Anaeromyxobacteraceae bacterium]|jgi:NADPH:quinone reductase-like Zn-dependent oxidoreductase|nr:medium chain dehydrogenase/reductase family protein [Anaeromyxobacteraceae bacterium]
MRAVWITRSGGPEVLEVREGPDPLPAAGEVRVRVRAAGLNFAEVMARQGLYPDAPKLPAVLGYEVGGVVDALGPGASGPAPGTRVMAMVRFGGHADVVCVPAAQAIPIPESMAFEEAAAIPVNYLTAYHMLFRVAAIRPGDRVLVHMAAGGVGIAVLQLCRTVEGVITFGTASESKHAILREEGCAYPIDYRTADWSAEVRRVTGGEGVDVVLDPLGGADTRKGYALLRDAGRLVCYGFANLSGEGARSYLRIARQMVQVPLFNPISLMNQNRAVAGVNVGHLWHAKELLAAELGAVLALHARGAIRPRIAASFPFAKAAEAHRFIQARRNVGKVLLVP